MTTAIIKPQWSPLTVALMVLGFVVWWPLGLAALAYILWGEHFGGSAERAGAFMNRGRSWAENCKPGNGFSHSRSWRGSASSGNAAFDDYRSEQLRRLEEERKRLDNEISEFHDYMRNLRMARDREEFDRFMRDRNAPRRDNGPENSQNIDL